jgi:hypothetical protein
LGVRIIVSILLLWHVTAVFIAGLSVPGSSMLAGLIGQYYMQWYLDALAMNRGHHFFAPDPPPGNLIQYEVTVSGREPIKGQFPSTKEYWPRLRYHRYFMLAAQAGIDHPEERVANSWTEKYLTAYALHLLREHEGERVRLRRVIHDVLPPPMWRRTEEREMALDDQRTYRIHLEVIKTRNDLEAQERASQAVSRRWTSGGMR